ncbi:hypothetical protein KW796_00465 [Candidatus Parcubacteria bacterium]|nr:hypothetical protein [Candidatus Parcubacteria bacterium]
MKRELTETLLSDVLLQQVPVDTTLSWKDMLESAGRHLYLEGSPEMIEAMPRGRAKKIEAYFFRLGYEMDIHEVKYKYKVHGLRPLDPYSLAAINAHDQDFADECNNATYWEVEAQDGWRSLAFHGGPKDRMATLVSRQRRWEGSWWFAGIPL